MNEYKNSRDGSDAERRIHKPRTPESFVGFKAHKNVFLRLNSVEKANRINSVHN